MKNFPWKDLDDKKIIAPFIPKVGDNFDKRYCEALDRIGEETQERYQNYLRNKDMTKVFINYTFIANDYKKTIKILDLKNIPPASTRHIAKSNRDSPTKSRKSSHIFDNLKSPTSRQSFHQTLKSPEQTPKPQIKLPPIDFNKLNLNKLLGSTSSTNLKSGNRSNTRIDNSNLTIHRKSSSLLDKRYLK
jgi:hypothetical protein